MPEEYNALLTKLSELLDDCLNAHPSPEAKEAFKKSTPTMNIRRVGTKGRPIDDEEFSVAEELGLPTLPFPNSEILEVKRSYEGFPTVAELLPKDPDSER